MRNSIQSAATTYFSGTIASGARRARHLGSGVTVILWLLTSPFSPTAAALCNNGCYAFGGENTALGEEAGTLGSLTTAIGSAALNQNTGKSNTAVGAHALNRNTTGSYNTSAGGFAAAGFRSVS